MQGTITSLQSHSVTLTTPTAESTQLEFDYAIYALGSHLPAPINLWGPCPSASSNKPRTAEVLRPRYGGTKAESVAWLKEHQHAVQSAESILVVGGGALGIQYATDIASVHPEKQVTLLHSRHRLLPRFDQSMHSESKSIHSHYQSQTYISSLVVIQVMEDINVNVILGERLDLSSTTQDPPKRNELGQRVVKTVTGREVSADLILLCTGQKPNVELLSSLDPCSISPDTGMARVLRTMQLASPTLRLASTIPLGEREPPMGEPAHTHSSDPEVMAPLSSAPQELGMETRFPHIFVVGDAADAFGVINAGRTADFQVRLPASLLFSSSSFTNCNDMVP